MIISNYRKKYDDLKSLSENVLIKQDKYDKNVLNTNDLIEELTNMKQKYIQMKVEQEQYSKLMMTYKNFCN